MYKFKSQLEDFFVQEKLAFEPKGEWDFLYILREKKWINTMDAVHGICKSLKLERYDLGIAGLKDKHGITQQRVSIGKKTLEKCGGEEKYIEEIKKYGTILQKIWHNELLRVWMNSWNMFTIRLRAEGNIDSKSKHLIKKQLNTIKHQWMPNYFWMQRFGKWYRNVKRANKFLYEEQEPNDKHIKFNLQAFASFHFNDFVKQRLNPPWVPPLVKGIRLLFLEWDLVMNGNNKTSDIGYVDGEKIQLFDYWKCKKNYEDRDFFSPDCLTDKISYSPERMPAWPIMGENMLLPPNQSEAFKMERNFLKKIKFFELEAFNRFQLYGLRRPMWVMPQDLKYEFENNDDLVLKFFLPTGSYATILLKTIFGDIDSELC